MSLTSPGVRKHTKIKTVLECSVKFPIYLTISFVALHVEKLKVFSLKVHFNAVFCVLDPKHLGRATVYYTVSKILKVLQYDASMPREYHNSDLLERRSL